MGKKSSKSPDVVGAAEREGEYSRETARDTTYADRPDQYNPFGSVTWGTERVLDPATGAPPPKIEDEVRLVMDSMKHRLEMAGMTMDDLVMVEVYCPDLTLYTPFNDVYRTYFKDHFPARAFLGSGPLLANGNFEVTGIAVKQ